MTKEKPSAIAHDISASPPVAVTDTDAIEREKTALGKYSVVGNCSRLPTLKSRTRRPLNSAQMRCLDDPWFGQEILLGMKVWTEEELAQHASVTVEQVGSWIRAGLPTLPTSDGSVRISEAVFDEWAKELKRHGANPITERANDAKEAVCPAPPAKHQLVIDPGTFSASYRGKSCKLGNTISFRLLELLNRRPGIYLPVRTLVQDVWKNVDTENGTVQKAVSNLRKQLKCITGIEIDGSQKDHYALFLTDPTMID